MSADEKRLLVQIVGGDDAPAELPRAGMLVIGSSAEKAGLHLEGQGVADVHCAIGRTKRGGWAVKDLGSDFGTFVNGERITQARLRAGDQILVGSRKLKVVDPEAAPAQAKPSAPKQAALKSAPPKGPENKAEASSPPLPQIPGYRGVRPLGRGAMGAVYLAVQESLDREVALKVLPQRLARDSDFVRRFQAEARAAAALNHPNVVTVHDVGQIDGLHFLTMEYMDRGSLEERVVGEGPLQWTAVLDVMKDAASGLVYAESRGIVHRDIKPANLMQNHTGATKIADLGLATQVEAEVAESESDERRIFGTPHFISPEQVRGLKADCRSDLYSLGATAYRLLSGHTPFEGDSSRDILRAKLRDDPRPLADFVDDLPGEVERIVTRLMQRDPEERYPSASALLRDIETLRNNAAPGGAGAAVAAQKGGAWKLVVGLAVVVGIAVLALLTGGGGSDGGGEPNRPDPNAVASGGPDANAATTVPIVPDATENADDGQTGAPGSGDGDDDAAERIFELKAKNAFLELGQRDLSPPDRRDALRVLAEEFQGTTVATQALEEAAQIESNLRIEERRVGERERELATILGALNSAGGLDGPPLPGGVALRAMMAVEGQEPFEADPVFVARRAALEDQAMKRALDAVEARREEAGALQRQGRFEEMRPLLGEILQSTELPEFPEGRAPNGALRMLEIRRELRKRIEGFDELVEAWSSERAQDDALAVARSLSGARGLQSDLARLDFEACEARLAALDAQLAVEENHAWVAELRLDLELAKKALEVLGTNYASWRRKSITDPRPRRSGFAEARGADAGGVQLEGDGGIEAVPWSVFGAQTAALNNLFYERLARDYTDDELRGIAALMRLTSVAEAAAQASEMFEPDSGAVFTPGEKRALTEVFATARDWARKAGSAAALDRESAAAGALADALQHASGEAWATAVADLERLLVEHEDTLLVRIFSDGSGLPVEEAAVEEPAPPEDGGSGEAEGEAAPGSDQDEQARQR